jgi:hypothetical protein
VVQPAALLPVFIAYADVAAARCAMSQCAATIARRRSSQRLQPMLWRFDQLNEPRWREMALHDAANAAAIVFALSDATPFHAGAEAWLTTLTTRHRGSPIDVIALMYEEPWTISLQQTVCSNEMGPPAANGNSAHPVTLAAMPRNKVTTRAA